MIFSQFPKLYTGVENRKEHLLKICYSAFYFAITFIGLHYVGHAISTANAWGFGYQPLFSYARMDSLAGTVNWTVSKVAMVYLAPPIWGLIVSIFAIVAYRMTEGKQTHLKTLFFWLGLNGYLLYFSYLVTAILCGQDYSSTMFTGFASYYAWLEWGTGKIYGIIAVQILLSLPFAVLFSKGVLQLNYSRLLAAKKNGKTIVFLNVILAPFLIGSALIILTTFPMDAGYQIVRLMCYIPVLIIIFLGMEFYQAKHISIVKGGLKPVSLVAISILIALLLASRFGLQASVQPFW